MILGLALPVALLVAAAILVPRALERVVPETLPGLILNGVLSALILTALGTGWFLLSYLWRSTAVFDLLGLAPAATLAYFLKLGLGTALIWAPVLVLAVASAPKRWRVATW